MNNSPLDQAHLQWRKAEFEKSRKNYAQAIAHLDNAHQFLQEAKTITDSSVVIDAVNAMISRTLFKKQMWSHFLLRAKQDDEIKNERLLEALEETESVIRALIRAVDPRLTELPPGLSLSSSSGSNTTSKNLETVIEELRLLNDALRMQVLQLLQELDQSKTDNSLLRAELDRLRGASGSASVAAGGDGWNQPADEQSISMTAKELLEAELDRVLSQEELPDLPPLQMPEF